MQDVPKIVRDRLRAVVPVVNHPDADILTAFSEGGLLEGERALVLEHLAGCGDCREIVALALPALDATQTVVHPAPIGWLRWSFLRWGFVALGAFAIASLGVVQYRKHVVAPSSMADFAQPETSVKEAKNVAPPTPGPSQPANDQEKAKLPAAAPVPPSASIEKEQPANAPAEFDRLQALTKLQKAENRAKKAIAGSLGGPVPHGPAVLQFQNGLNQTAMNQNASAYQVNGNSVPSSVPGAATSSSPFSKQAPNAFIDGNANAAPTAQAVEVQAQSQPLEVQGRNTQSLTVETKSLPLEPTQGGQGHSERDKETGLVMGVSRAKVPVSSPAPPGTFTGALSPPSASWTIASGALQRSLDQGKTWQNVNVNTPPAAAANYTLAVQAARASAADAKRDDKDSALKREAVTVFRAVAAIGSDVWAGGSSGLLYHSVDSGAHWVRIQPSVGEAVLTGDIVSLDFPDAQHGKVTTSTPEIWRTADGGQTWQKQ